MKTARIYTNDFNRIITATKDFVSQFGSRKYHQFIKLEFRSEASMVTAIAVDGYRMSVETAVISDCEEDFDVYVKSNIKLPNKMYAQISLEETEAIIRCNGFSFGYEQPSGGEFLDWQKVIPTEEVAYKIAFNGNYLLQALQAARISNGGFSTPVVLEFRSPVSPILIKTGKNNVKMVLPIRIKE